MRKPDQAGFTLIELLIVIVVSSLFSSLVLYFGFSYWRYSSLLQNDLDTFVSRLNAQDVVRELIGTSSGLLVQNSIPDSHAHNTDASLGSNYWVQLHAVPSTISVGSSGTTTPLLYFRRLSINTSNAIAVNGSLPYEDEYILYINGTTKQLLLRSLANPNVVNNKLKTSCPATLATNSCPADKVVIDDLSSITSIYYSRSGNTIDYHSSTDPDTGAYTGPDFPAVEALQYTIHVTKKALFIKGTTATSNDTIVRIALRNT